MAATTTSTYTTTATFERVPATLVRKRPMASATTAPRPGTRRCGFPECAKTAKPGGFCISHGGGKKCAVSGCTTSVVSRGFCVAHGGGKRCQREGCTKSAQTGGYCWIHGGGKKCGYQGCMKRAQSGGACISHGGGKRCRIEGCNKVVQYDGLCVGHGGYRKCLSINCSKKAMPNGYCMAHGGNSMCNFKDCDRKAVRGGFCAEHKSIASPLTAPVAVRAVPAPAALPIKREPEEAASSSFRIPPAPPTRDHRVHPLPHFRFAITRPKLQEEFQVFETIKREVVPADDTPSLPSMRLLQHSHQFDFEDAGRRAMETSFIRTKQFQAPAVYDDMHEKPSWVRTQHDSAALRRHERMMYASRASSKSFAFASEPRNKCCVPTCTRFAKIDVYCLLHAGQPGTHPSTTKPTSSSVPRPLVTESFRVHSYN